MSNVNPLDVGAGVGAAVEDAWQRALEWCLAHNMSAERAAQHFTAHSQVYTWPQTWGNTSGMLGDVGGSEIVATQVTVVSAGGAVPAYCYQDGTFIYELDISGNRVHNRWFADRCLPTRADVEKTLATSA